MAGTAEEGSSDEVPSTSPFMTGQGQVQGPNDVY